MMKTITQKTFDGQNKTTTYRLDKHNVGHPTEWWNIVYLTVDGKSLTNKWGGLHSRNVGKPLYIQKIWNTL
jgi:hypothetical protein